jgi:hypothetical protein
MIMNHMIPRLRVSSVKKCAKLVLSIISFDFAFFVVDIDRQYMTHMFITGGANVERG